MGKKSKKQKPSIDEQKSKLRGKRAAAAATGTPSIPDEMRVVGGRIAVRFTAGKLRILPEDQTRVLDATFEMGMDNRVAEHLGGELQDAWRSIRQARGIKSVSLSRLIIEDQNVTLFLVPDGSADIELKNVPVTKIKLVRDGKKDPDINLFFTISAACSGGDAAWLHRNYKNVMWIELEPAQGGLFER